METHRDLLVSLQAEVARNYLELRGTQQRLTTAEKNLVALQKTFALARDRQTSGFGNRLDVAQAETLLALNRAQLPALENSIGQADYRLCLLLGLPPGALTDELNIRKNMPQPSDLLPESLPSELLRRRPDIRSAERQLAAATAEVGVAVAGLFPQFSLTGLLGLQSNSLSNLLSSGSRYWSVGPSISWSLFNGGSRRANIELNQARREEAQITYEKTVLNALGEVESTLLSLSHEEEIQTSLATAAQSAARALELATGRYQAGLSGLLDVLVSERALYQSEDQLILSSLQRNTDLVALFKSLGGGWSMAAPTQIETPGEKNP
jgi:NodT family efflux transporter outer membrane factor (OMF) lipoprotein